MANERFKVKFGLAVGDTAATIDATTGDIVTTGDLTVNGTPSADITTTTATASVFNTGATTVNIAGAATTVSIGANTGTTTVNNSLVADDISVTTVDTTNLQVSNIKAKNGAAAMTIADTTGVVTVSTELNVDNINIKDNTISSTNLDGNIILNPNGTGDVFANADTLRVGDVAATAKISSNGATNLEITTNNGTASPKISISTGSNSNIQLAASGSGFVNVGNGSGTGRLSTEGANNLELSTNSGSNSGTITISHGAASNILITPNTTGDVYLQSDTVFVGDANATATITTNGTGNLVLNTNAGTNAGTVTLANGAFTSTGSSISGTTLTIGTLSTGTIQVGQSIHGGTVLTNTVITANISGSGSGSTWTVSKSQTVASASLSGAGNITLAPNTVGDIALTFNNGGNLINSRNYVFGEIRNATTESNGDIWVLDADAGGAGTLPVRGVSIDNSGVETTKNAGVVVRNYSATAGFSPRVVFERSRGTAASPTTLSSGDAIGTIAATGYSSTLNWINDTLPFAPAVINLTTSEAWVNNTNLGTNFAVLLAPTATTMTTAANLITTITHNPQSATYRSDAFTFRQGKTGTTDLLLLGTTNSTLKAKNINLRDTSNDINNVLVTPGDPAGAGFNDRVAQIRQFSAITNTGEASTMTFQSARYNTGTSQYSPTLSGDEVGTFFFNGNYNTGATTAVNGPTARFGARATETWTSTANGGRFYVETINTGTITSTERMSLSNTEAKFRSDAITLQNAAGTALTSAAVNYTRTYGEFAYANAAGFAIAAQNTIYEMPLDTTLVSSGTSISNTSRININVSGFYKIFMSLQSTLTVSNQPGQFDFWLRKNGADVPNSKTQVDLLKDQKTVTSMHWLVESDGNDYWEIVYVGTTANYADIDFPTIAATTTPYVSPVAPALLVNVIPVGM